MVLPDGSVDPWHSLALVEPLTPLQQALNLTPVFIDGAPSLRQLRLWLPDTDRARTW